MNEQPQQNELKSPVESETDVVALLKKMQQQLIYLEKKVDTLIHQSQVRPPFGDKNFSRPHRPFGRPFHRTDGESGGGHPGKSFRPGRSFDKRPGEGDPGGFGHKKRSFDKDREGGSGQKRPFKKWHGGGEGSGPKKSPYYQQFKHKH